MRLVLEHHEPVFRFSVNRHGHDDGGGVDFLGNFEVVELAPLLEFPHGEQRDVHQANRFVLAAEFPPQREVAFPRLFDGSEQRGIVEGDAVQARQERRVPAVVGPVGVEHADFRQRRPAALFVAEVFLHEREVGVAHRQPEFPPQRGELFGRFSGKIFEARNRRGRGNAAAQRLGNLERGFAGINGIDEVGLDAREIFVGDVPADHVDERGSDQRTFLAREHLHALRRGIRALVKLPGQIFHGENFVVRAARERVFENVVDLRLGENRRERLAEILLAEPVDVVALRDAQIFRAGQAERLPQILQDGFGVFAERRFLFNKNALHGRENKGRDFLRSGAARQRKTPFPRGSGRGGKKTLPRKTPRERLFFFGICAGFLSRRPGRASRRRP